MKSIKLSKEFETWFSSLRDFKAQSIIKARIYRLECGNYGDYKYLSDGVLELRIFYGAGYRVYFTERVGEIVIILAGGTKSGQSRDIKKAIEISKLF
ncbi:MAG: type II toxin-antitoxin system RelE/ParE family toxin [Bdellovibrionales bacterium]